MIEATIKFVEQKSGLVDIEICTLPANKTETDRETLMLVTFMALNSCLSQAEYFTPLGAVLGPEIRRILAGDSDDQNIN